MAVHTLPRYTRRTVFPSVRHTGSPWPGLRAPWKGKQGGHTESTATGYRWGQAGAPPLVPLNTLGNVLRIQTHSNTFKRECYN